ncbi:sulfotransferase [Alphaproteobacteria bacterium]|nr:sulfotransferase [Alphaproteobacteria bacterium]
MFGDSVKPTSPKTIKLTHSENISFPLVFIDGVTRCGKSSLSKVIPSFTQMEHINFLSQMEWLLPAYALGHVSKDYAKSHLGIYFNELTYNLLLSRNVNFRPTDQTGVANYKEPQIYFDRLKVNDGLDIIKECQTKKNYIPFQTHDLMVNIAALNNLSLDYKMVSLWRNPVENLYSWVTRGWGSRFRNSDPQNFTLSIKTDMEETLPWYCGLDPLPKHKLNDAEFCVYVGINLIKRAVFNAKKNPYGNLVKFVFFEELFTNPLDEVKRISDFLGVDWTEKTQPAIYEANFPRELDKETYSQKINFFKEHIRESLFEDLMNMESWYVTSKYGIE